MNVQQPPVDGASKRRHVTFALIACALLPATCTLHAVEGYLLETGVLNRRDLRPLGREHGTFGEYALNVWMWDGALLVLSLLAVPLFAFGVWLLTRTRPAP